MLKKRPEQVATRTGCSFPALGGERVIKADMLNSIYWSICNPDMPSKITKKHDLICPYCFNIQRFYQSVPITKSKRNSGFIFTFHACLSVTTSICQYLQMRWKTFFKSMRRCSVIKVSSSLQVGRKIWIKKKNNNKLCDLAGDLNARSFDKRSAFTSSIIHISWCNTAPPVARRTHGRVTRMHIHAGSCEVLKGACVLNSNAIHFLLSMCWRRLWGHLHIHTRISKSHHNGADLHPMARKRRTVFINVKHTNMSVKLSRY